MVMQYVIPALFFLTGVWLLYIERAMIRLGFHSYFWPKVEGKIVERSQETFVTYGVTGSAATALGDVQWEETAYMYVYRVDGRSYFNTNYCYGGWADRLEAFYNIGQQVTVCFDPKDPKQAVLKPGLTFGALFGLVPIASAAAYPLMLKFIRGG